MSNPIKLLVVEDDPNLGSLLLEYLRAKGYEADLRTDGQQGKVAYTTARYDLLLLDVMMPLKDGFTLAKEIRAKDSTTPILFLTAKSMKQDKMKGFEIGADDYVTKPFSHGRAAAAHIRRAAPRERGRAHRSPNRRNTAWAIPPSIRASRSCAHPTANAALPPRKATCCACLCANRNEVLERSRSPSNEVWGNDSYFSGRSMDVYIAKLRKYLREDPGVEIINVHGKGFRLLAGPGPE